MRQPAIVRLSGPRKSAATPARVNAAETLNSFIRVFEDRLRPLLDPSRTGLTRPEHRLLAALAETRGRLARDVALALAIDAGQLSRMVQRLEGQGLLLRLPAKDDGRQSPLALTAKGRAALHRAGRAVDGSVAKLLTGMPKADQQELARALASAEALLKHAK